MRPGNKFRRRIKSRGQITRVNAITVTGSGTQASVSTTGLTLQQNDYLVVGIELDNSGINEILTGFSGNQSGAYQNQQDVAGTDTLRANLFTGCQFMGATGDSTITVSWSSATSLSWRARIVQFRNVDQAVPQDATAVTANGANTDLADAPAITTVTANAVVVALLGAMAASSATPWTGPSNMSNFVESAGGGSRVGSCDSVVATPGSFNPNACTGGDNTATDSWCAVTYALRPA